MKKKNCGLHKYYKQMIWQGREIHGQVVYDWLVDRKCPQCGKMAKIVDVPSDVISEMLQITPEEALHLETLDAAPSLVMDK